MHKCDLSRDLQFGIGKLSVKYGKNIGYRFCLKSGDRYNTSPKPHLTREEFVFAGVLVDTAKAE